MRKLYRILDSGWFFLLALATLIAGGRLLLSGLEQAGAVLAILSAAASAVSIARMIRAGRYLRRKAGKPDESIAEKE